MTDCNPIANFVGLGVGSIRLKVSLANYDNLKYLFAIDSTIILTDSDGEEIDLKDIIQDHTYHVLSEEDLNDESPYSIDPEHLTEEMKTKIGQQRYMRLLKMQEARVSFIKKHYQPKHPQIYNLNRSFFCKEFLDVFDKSPQNTIDQIMNKETETKLYSFELFNEEFRKLLVEEVENFENSGLPISRPNSMNNYGLILDEIGFTKFFDDLIEDYICPLSKIIFPKYGSNLDSHHAFIVKYKLGEDTNLDFHYDSSDVTLNVCLGKDFIGGSLYFCGHLLDKSTHNEHYEYQNSPGKTLLHLGQHRHGANPITSGERYNLIVWCRQKRNQCCCGHSCGK